MRIDSCLSEDFGVSRAPRLSDLRFLVVPLVVGVDVASDWRLFRLSLKWLLSLFKEKRHLSQLGALLSIDNFEKKF